MSMEHHLPHIHPPPSLQLPLLVLMFIWWEWKLWAACREAGGGGLRCQQMSAHFTFSRTFPPDRKLKFWTDAVDRLVKRSCSYVVTYQSVSSALHTSLHDVNPPWIPCVQTPRSLIEKTLPLFILPQLRRSWAVSYKALAASVAAVWRAELLRVCLPGSPRHQACTVGLCQGKQLWLPLYAALWHSQSPKKRDVCRSQKDSWNCFPAVELSFCHTLLQKEPSLGSKRDGIYFRLTVKNCYNKIIINYNKYNQYSRWIIVMKHGCTQDNCVL